MAATRGMPIVEVGRARTDTLDREVVRVLVAVSVGDVDRRTAQPIGARIEIDIERQRATGRYRAGGLLGRSSRLPHHHAEVARSPTDPRHETGEDLGGPSTAEFVQMVQKEGAPLALDQLQDSLLHTLPLFRELDRSRLGGCFYDPTRPWEEQLCKEELPVTERIVARLVRFPRQFNGISESYVRRCAAAVKKVLVAVLPSTAPAASKGPALAEEVSSQASSAR